MCRETHRPQSPLRSQSCLMLSPEGSGRDSLMNTASRPTFNPLLFVSHRPVFKAAL